MGEYYIYNKWKLLREPSEWPRLSHIILNTKSSKLISRDDLGKIKWRYVLKVISNFYGHLLKNYNIFLKGIITAVPAKDIYPINSLDDVVDELADIFNLTKNLNILKRISNENPEYRLKQDISHITKLILVDDVLTSGTTIQNIYTLFQDRINEFYVIILGKSTYI
ncbi:MAG: hypothetical protein ACTSU2_09765 [Promethearchaeota archaeon]